MTANLPSRAKLSIGTGRTSHSGTLTGVEFNVVDDRTQRNVAQEERLPTSGATPAPLIKVLAYLAVHSEQ